MSIEAQLSGLSAQLTEVTTLLKGLGSTPMVKADTAEIEARMAAAVTETAQVDTVEATIQKTEAAIQKADTIATPVLQLTESAKTAGYTLEQFYDIGWTDDVLVKEGHAVWVTPNVETVTADELNTLLGAKAEEMNDDGAAIFKLLKDTYKVNGVKELDTMKYAKLKADVEAL